MVNEIPATLVAYYTEIKPDSTTKLHLYHLKYFDKITMRKFKNREKKIRREMEMLGFKKIVTEGYYNRHALPNYLEIKYRNGLK